MTYSVHQHWDPLKVCAVGRSYPPEFYSFIKNSRVRDVMERIAAETEEDYQKLIKLLESFSVEIVRPELEEDFSKYLKDGKYQSPIMMTPRDDTAMIGDRFFMPDMDLTSDWERLRGTDWPDQPMNEEQFNNLPDWLKKELTNRWDITKFSDILRPNFEFFSPIEKLVKENNNNISYGLNINTAMTTRIGKDLYFGTDNYDEDQIMLKKRIEKLFPDYRCHVINTGGHSDGTFCPVVPGLIVSLYDVPSYAETFPDWEVVYLPGQSWSAVKPFLDLKEKNRGKWWVPGEELNDDFTQYVEEWLGHWVGYVEETVFDVNMLVIDEKNVVCNNYNEKVFEAFSRHGITPHVINFRHRYFWDGGLHCITSDLHREGTQKDYFPERRLT
jgi:hypothetical protein